MTSDTCNFGYCTNAERYTSGYCGIHDMLEETEGRLLSLDPVGSIGFRQPPSRLPEMLVMGEHGWEKVVTINRVAELACDATYKTMAVTPEGLKEVDCKEGCLGCASRQDPCPQHRAETKWLECMQCGSPDPEIVDCELHLALCSKCHRSGFRFPKGAGAPDDLHGLCDDKLSEVTSELTAAKVELDLRGVLLDRLRTAIDVGSWHNAVEYAENAIARAPCTCFSHMRDIAMDRPIATAGCEVCGCEPVNQVLNGLQERFARGERFQINITRPPVASIYKATPVSLEFKYATPKFDTVTKEKESPPAPSCNTCGDRGRLFKWVDASGRGCDPMEGVTSLPYDCPGCRPPPGAPATQTHAAPKMESAFGPGDRKEPKCAGCGDGSSFIDELEASNTFAAGDTSTVVVRRTCRCGYISLWRDGIRADPAPVAAKPSSKLCQNCDARSSWPQTSCFKCGAELKPEFCLSNESRKAPMMVCSGCSHRYPHGTENCDFDLTCKGTLAPMSEKEQRVWEAVRRDGEREKSLRGLFQSHDLDSDQQACIHDLRHQGAELAALSDIARPRSADRTAAVRLLQDAVSTAIRSIALMGKGYRDYESKED